MKRVGYDLLRIKQTLSGGNTITVDWLGRTSIERSLSRAKETLSLGNAIILDWLLGRISIEHSLARAKATLSSGKALILGWLGRASTERSLSPARRALNAGSAIWQSLGWPGRASITSGLLVSIGGAVWAVIAGTAIPVAIMLGYCTFVSVIYLMMAPAAFRALAKGRLSDQAPPPQAPRVNYEAWSHVDRYTLNQAAHLWCDIDPNSTDTPDSDAWISAFAAALRKGELKYDTSSETLAVTRVALKDFAKRHGYDPRFLRD